MDSPVKEERNMKNNPKTGNHLLSQAKRRDKKVEITDVSIAKVPFIMYKGFTFEENQKICQLAKTVLILAKEENNSNEVAITYDLERKDLPYGIAFGNEHSVDICSDTRSFHILLSARRTTVIMLHNHPSTKTFSLEDLRFLLTYDSIRMMIVISNQGKIHYISKEEDFDRDMAIQLYSSCVGTLSKSSNIREIYFAAKQYLLKCHTVGLFYC